MNIHTCPSFITTIRIFPLLRDRGDSNSAKRNQELTMNSLSKKLILTFNYIRMFDGPDYPKALDENDFTQWLENGRVARIGYTYLVIIWDEYESVYQPVYVSDREEIESLKESGNRERFIAAYDLYSESRIS